MLEKLFGVYAGIIRRMKGEGVLREDIQDSKFLQVLEFLRSLWCLCGSLRTCIHCPVGEYTPMKGMMQCIGCPRGRSLQKSTVSGAKARR